MGIEIADNISLSCPPLRLSGFSCKAYGSVFSSGTQAEADSSHRGTTTRSKENFHKNNNSTSRDGDGLFVRAGFLCCCCGPRKRQRLRPIRGCLSLRCSFMWILLHKTLAALVCIYCNVLTSKAQGSIRGLDHESHQKCASCVFKSR